MRRGPSRIAVPCVDSPFISVLCICLGPVLIFESNMGAVDESAPSNSFQVIREQEDFSGNGYPGYALPLMEVPPRTIIPCARS